MNKYGGGAPFRGPPYQLGYGLGGSFRKFFKWIVPLVKEHTIPHIKSGLADLGRTAIGSVGDFARDVANGQDLHTSAKLHLHNAVENVKHKIEKKLRGGKRKKRGIIRKNRIILKKKSKKFEDIFV